MRLKPSAIITSLVVTLIAIAIINRVPALRNLTGGSPTS